VAACNGGGDAADSSSSSSSGSGFPEIVLQTEKGEIRIEMDPVGAPEASNLLSALILTGTYDNQTFFDVQPGALIQFGDTDPAAARVESLPVENTGTALDRGAVAIAWVGSKNTTTHRLIFPLTRLDAGLDEHFTVFGQIVGGENVLDQLVVGDTVSRVSARLTKPILRLVTDVGSIVIELAETEAPNHVARISDLTCQGFYSGLTFHRVEPALVQTGDPTGTGEGGSGVTLRAEISERRFFRTAVGMARQPDDLDSADSQFFIMRQQVRSLDGGYTFVGQVLAGMQAVDAIQLGDTILDAVLQFDLQGRDCAGATEAPPPPVDTTPGF
jgi:cyclophilin family peptidyl-prolyl cis-trans isomerase